jgi:hypothetical protein
VPFHCQKWHPSNNGATTHNEKSFDSLPSKDHHVSGMPFSATRIEATISAFSRRVFVVCRLLQLVRGLVIVTGVMADNPSQGLLQ